MSPYAADTSVPVERSRAEIERTLTRYGATAFAYGWSGEQSVVEFATDRRRIRFTVKMPLRTERRFTHSARGLRSDTAAADLYEKACRQRWRALALVIKAKLEAIESGISSFEDEFLAFTVLPDGTTAGQWLQPQVDRAYETGTMPPMLPALGSGS